jgi:multicomponent Na+:H+ antiporter subunit D
MSGFATPEQLIVVAVLAPFAGALIIPLFGRWPNLRETVTLATSVVLCLSVASLLPAVLAGSRPEVQVLDVAPGLSLAFQVEPLGMLFALVAASLWIVNSIYSIGYMRGNKEPRQTGFYVCFALALGSTIGLAFSRNLFTLFLFYEALTLVTYPLVTHKQDGTAARAGRLYLLMLLGGSLVLFLPAIVATWLLAGTLEFTPGGILGGRADGFVLSVLLVLYAFGIGKAALMPMHFWLPAAMVAPTPVSALLHAVAVVKAGVFTVLKVAIYVFGIDTLSAHGLSDWLVYFGSACLLLASIIALTRDNLKARLAYSTVSQLAYVIVGAALATKLSIVGGGLHIAMHAAGKITLFFCAGAIYTAHHLTEVSQLTGIGRRMPVTMFAFLLGSLSIIGLPPFGGTWSKWMLAMGALDAGHMFVVGVLMISSLLNVAYLLPIVARAFFLPPPKAGSGVQVTVEEAPLPCLIALGTTALLCIVLFFQAGAIESLLLGIFAR